ncbi:MAG: helix-turn-helix transcriptional regulator [bacterium]
MIKNRLKILLAERDLNYSKLSKMTGISVNALSQMGKAGGTGSRQIRYAILDKLCEALNCGIGDLLIRVTEKKKMKK